MDREALALSFGRPQTTSAMRWFSKKPVWVPTWRSWLAIVFFILGLLAVSLFTLHPFLAVNRPVMNANVLVVEGWVADYVIEAAAAAFRTNGYEYLVCSGGPLPKGYLLSEYSTYANLAAASFRKLDIPEARILVAPAERTYRRRTLMSAKGVQARLEQEQIRIDGLNVVTQGAHARRTWRTYRAVFGPEIPVGVLSFPSQDYDPDRWWTSSEGAKITIAEAIGWMVEWLGTEE